MKAFWSRFLHWNGWKKIFPMPVWADALLFTACCAGLIWVFINGLELWWPAYILYGLSAYSLTALCIHIPAAVRMERSWRVDHPKADAFLRNKELKFSLELYAEQFINFAYGIYKIAAGMIVGSAWIGADGLYNLAQAAIQLLQILKRRKNLNLMQQWKSYRLCGWMILGMHLTITGLVFQMTRMGRSEEYPGYLIFVTALFAFYKLISAFVDVAKDRKNKAPVDSSVMLLNLAQALFSLYSLQAAMIHQFEGSAEFAVLMNTLTGCAVCLMVVAMGIYMLHRSRREMRKLEEIENV